MRCSKCEGFLVEEQYPLSEPPYLKCVNCGEYFFPEIRDRISVPIRKREVIEEAVSRWLKQYAIF